MLRLLSPSGVLAAALASAAPAFAITGVCPDGSIFIVQSASDIPCKQAKRIESHEVPPVRPENLPRPYLWEVHREKLDQNNPYNLVDRAAQMRKLGRSDTDGVAGAAPHAAESGTRPAPSAIAAGAPHAAPASASEPLPLGLSDGEVRDLFFLVELSQQHAPATFTLPAAHGSEALRVSFAWSQAFEDRVRRALPSGEGKPLLFTVQAREPTSFQPNFTFVQGSSTFTPKRNDVSQFGILQGHAGALAARDLVLGYVVLPAGVDLARPVDMYWDDRRLAATLRP
jgi:hypothetical protein